VPELPETETIARDLQSQVTGLRIADVEVARPDVLRRVKPAALRTRLLETHIARVWRRAKIVVIDVSSGDHVLVQPRFTGRLIVGERADADAYTAVSLSLSDERVLRYADVRRLGTVALATNEEFDAISRDLGVEPLDPAFTTERLSGILRSSSRAVKAVLMDQKSIAGVGNIYASEALWRARLDPSRSANALDAENAERLRAALVEVLCEAVDARGTSFRDYRDGFGGRGGFSASLVVYGREGVACPRCGTRITATHAIDGRSTFFCHRCQL
jgi:formamidopyrimidine-DNA glycosylase